MIIVTDRETHKSRGFGYVVFSNPDDAKEAMSSMAGERGKVCGVVIFNNIIYHEFITKKCH